jgi:uncharacterized protein (TIGR02145 family)
VIFNSLFFSLKHLRPIVFSFANISFLFAQVDREISVKIKNVEQKGQKIEIIFDVNELKSNSDVGINFHFYIEGTKEKFIPKHVEGDLFDVFPGTNKKISWDFKKDYYNVSGELQPVLKVVDPCVNKDGTQFEIAKLGRNYWMLNNVHIDKGSTKSIGRINSVMDKKVWANSKGPAIFEIDSTRKNGSYFNYYSLKNNSLVCPTGWRIPSVEDFKDMKLFLNNPELYFETKAYSNISSVAGNGLTWFVGDSPRGCINEFGIEVWEDSQYLWWAQEEDIKTNEGVVFILSNGSLEFEDYFLSKNSGVFVRCIHSP